MSYFAHPTAVIDRGAQIGAGSSIWHFCHLMPGAVLGDNCNLGQNVFVADGVRLGDGVKVQNNVSLYSGLTCESEVFIGPSAVFTNVRNPRSAMDRRGAYLPTILGRGATVGANATIICGCRVGTYAFVGAGAVVTRDVPAYGLVMGVPARRVGWMSRAGHRLQFDAAGVAVCPEDRSRYVLHDGAVSYRAT